jgi:hypothetical protein
LCTCGFASFWVPSTWGAFPFSYVLCVYMNCLLPGTNFFWFKVKCGTSFEILLSTWVCSCNSWGVQIIQLYETTLVRHGLMLVGPTGGGKTCNYRALAGAMSLLNLDGSKTYEKVHC